MSFGSALPWQRRKGDPSSRGSFHFVGAQETVEDPPDVSNAWFCMSKKKKTTVCLYLRVRHMQVYKSCQWSNQ